MVIETKAFAKINITLDILSKREDGYHNVEMIMQTIDLCDYIYMSFTNTGRIRIKTNLEYLPVDNRNLVYRAIELFYKTTKIEFSGMDVNIKKNIPVGAGLAGGSSNAASVLKELNKHHGFPISIDDLCSISKCLGADVPYCILGGTMLAKGIGDELYRLEPMPDCYVVLAKPPFSLSTRLIYSKIRCHKLKNRPDTKGVIKALEVAAYKDIAVRLYNVMEDISAGMVRSIPDIKDILIDIGADGVAMSGSGPAVYGMFSDRDLAHNAYSILKEKYTDTFLSKILNTYV